MHFVDFDFDCKLMDFVAGLLSLVFCLEIQNNFKKEKFLF